MTDARKGVVEKYRADVAGCPRTEPDVNGGPCGCRDSYNHEDIATLLATVDAQSAHLTLLRAECEAWREWTKWRQELADGFDNNVSSAALAAIESQIKQEGKRIVAARAAVDAANALGKESPNAA